MNHKAQLAWDDWHKAQLSKRRIKEAVKRRRVQVEMELCAMPPRYGPVRDGRVIKEAS